jgi:DnaK suppressor protein
MDRSVPKSSWRLAEYSVIISRSKQTRRASLEAREKEIAPMPSSAVRAAKMTKKETEKYRRLLEQKKNSLSTELAKTRNAEEETTEESTQDIADKAVSSYTREFLYSLSDTDRSLLVRIDLALDRIEEGAYGLCQNCGQPMSEKRLNAVPWALLCVDCQELSEKGLLET